MVAEARAMNVFGRHNAFESRLDDFFRSGRNNVERKLVAFPSAEDFEKELNILLQANLLSDGSKVFFTDTSKFGIMQQQISEFSALLHQMNIGKAFHALFERTDAN